MGDKLLYTLCLVLFSATLAVAENGGTTAAAVSAATHDTAGHAPAVPVEANPPTDASAKTLKGMSVLGNNEAPMSLVIVSWKGSELGAEANLSRTLNERDVPVDRDVFLRELNFYQVSVGRTP